MDKNKILFCNSFIIKVFALFFMTLDHVGLLIRTMSYQMNAINISNILRGFGRLALPLFVFMIVEGVIHTKNIKKYFLRLGILAIIITIVLMILAYVDFGFDTSAIAGAGNIFLDLLLIALTIYLLKQDNVLLKPLAILPIGLAITSFIVKAYQNDTGAIIYWYPTWLYLQYDWFSLVLGVGFYLAYKAGDLYISIMNNYGIDESYWDINGNRRFLYNLLAIFFLAVVSVLYYLFVYIWSRGVFWDAKSQLLAIIAGAYILLYNGKRGYNAKWFQYGSYLYYPLHLIIIIVIFIIANGGF